MKKGDVKKNNGFTIIEVALVLAIGGLIFLMVFIALPALQRSQRDTRRREDILSFLSLVKKYQTNNRGALPTDSPSGSTVTQVTWSNTSGDNTTWRGFYRDYLGGSFVDPSGDNYKLLVVNCGVSSADTPCDNSTINNVYSSSFPYQNYSLVVVVQATCYGDKAVGSSNPRKLAVLYRMEGAGVYCANT